MWKQIFRGSKVNFTKNYFKKKIIIIKISRWIYDGLAFSPTGHSRLHISSLSLPPKSPTLVDSNKSFTRVVENHAFHASTNDNGEKLVATCEALSLRPA